MKYVILGEKATIQMHTVRNTTYRNTPPRELFWRDSSVGGSTGIWQI